MTQAGTPQVGSEFFMRYDAPASASGALTQLPKTASSECGFYKAR